ncbi:DEAD/DEAH box helicase [Sporobolomyces koalae]|uniref:DEAD/DEAH box helicase n=1 Tax=Sporobolomyces koalae TaxID=500713 RepID=UPI00316DFA6E
MFSAAAPRPTILRPRETSTIDLTLSTDDEYSPVKLARTSRPRPPVLESDSDDDDDAGNSDLEILSSRLQGSSRDGVEIGMAATLESSLPKLVEPRGSKAPRSDSSTSDDSTSSSSDESEDEAPEVSKDTAVARPQPAQAPPRAVGTTSSMAEALAGLSFKKKPSPDPERPVTTTQIDSAQEAALRNQGLLPNLQRAPPPVHQGSFYTQRSHPPYQNSRTTFQPNVSRFQHKPFAAPSPSTFASNSNAFNLKAQPISVKGRIGAQIQHENKAKGIPISVPSNPPPSIVRREGKVPPVAKVAIDVDAELEAFGTMEIEDGMKEDKAVAAFREGLGVSNVDVEETELDEAPPPHLNCTLLPHQVDSLRWLLLRESGHGKNHGGLLADDMGLGKTIQMLALILSHPSDCEDGMSKTTIIVCPVGLLRQWKLEIENKTSKYLRVHIHHGPSRSKDALSLHKYDVVVTNYETVLSDNNSRRALFESNRPFYRVILDEAHTIKNPSTKTSQACSALRAEYRWALTGTPIQNSVNDLFSIFRFLGKRVIPDQLWDKSIFDDRIGRPIKSKQNKVAFERLSIALGSVMKRRTKSTTVNGRPILQLPKRDVTIVRGTFLDADEEAFYKAIEEKMVLQYNAYLKGVASGESTQYAQVLVRLLRMRQATNHPALVTKASIESDQEALDPGAKKEEEGKPISKVKGSSSCLLCGQGIVTGIHCQSCATELSTFPGLQSSTKVKRTMQLLDQFRRESKGLDKDGKKISPKKVIIFSQFTSMLVILEKFLKAAGYKFVRFDGQCSIKEKDAAVEKITNDLDTTIILISIKAGAVGLNLTMCSRVILLDLWFNPAIEEQAFDRAHRYGQKDDVQIYKLVIDNTVEDRILTLQAQKAELASSALEGGVAAKAKLSAQDMAFLFKGNLKNRKKKATEHGS